jgi:hypothetical protein
VRPHRSRGPRLVKRLGDRAYGDPVKESPGKFSWCVSRRLSCVASSRAAPLAFAQSGGRERRCPRDRVHRWAASHRAIPSATVHSSGPDLLVARSVSARDWRSRPAFAVARVSGARACLAPVVRTERSAQQHRGVRFRGAGNVCRRRRRLMLGVRTAGAPPAACRAQAAGRKPSHRMRWLGDRLAMGRSRLRPWCGWESGDLHHRARASDHAGPFRHRHGCHDRGVEIGGVPARRRTNSRLPGWG